MISQEAFAVTAVSLFSLFLFASILMDEPLRSRSASWSLFGLTALMAFLVLPPYMAKRLVFGEFQNWAQAGLVAMSLLLVTALIIRSVRRRKELETHMNDRQNPETEEES